MLCWEEGGECFSPACSVRLQKFAGIGSAEKNALVLQALFAHKICGCNAPWRTRRASAVVLHALFSTQNLPEWTARGEFFSPACSVLSNDVREQGGHKSLVLHALLYSVCSQNLPRRALPFSPAGSDRTQNLRGYGGCTGGCPFCFFCSFSFSPPQSPSLSPAVSPPPYLSLPPFPHHF